jgi:ribosomal protein S18 acetylase RimI-like enzyme
MDSFIIRRARPTLEDASRILAVEHASLGDSDYTPAEALGVLRRPEHSALLALDGKDAVGFCSCLRTPASASAAARFEIDLLGVLPSHQGRGLGTALIRAAQCEAQGQGIRLFRAVVAVDNAASLGAFAHVGMRPCEPPRALLVYAIQGFTQRESLPPAWTARALYRGAVAAPSGGAFSAGKGRTLHRLTDGADRTVALAECLEVHTLGYRGLWVEQTWSDSERALGALARWLVEYAKKSRLDEVGHLCSAPEDAPARQVWREEGMSTVGDYYVLHGEAP